MLQSNRLPGLRGIEQRLKTTGWVSWELNGRTESEISECALATARLLGAPVPLRASGNVYQKLKPTIQSDANPNSLSRIFSLGEFPLHVDTAHWGTPCRFVILACIAPGSGERETLLLDTRRITLTTNEIDLLHSTPFRVVNGRNSFFAPILSPDRPFIRYDPGCMRPASADGERVRGFFALARWSQHIEAINWRPNQAVLIDNWRVLHGRSSATIPDTERTLLRVLIQ